MVLVAREEFVDPDPLLSEKLEERVRELEDQYPEPRSNADERRLKRKRRRLMREFHIARGAAERGPWEELDHQIKRLRRRQGSV